MTPYSFSYSFLEQQSAYEDISTKAFSTGSLGARAITMATQKINVTVNLDALRGELQRSLQKAIYLVSAGLQTNDKIDPELLRLPTNSVTMTFDGGLTWDSEEAQKQYSEWILSNGFRDVIEGVNAFIESAHRVLSFWKIAEKQKDGAEITGSDWNDIVISGGKRFHRLGLPDKFDHLSKEHGIEVEPSYREQVLSIDIARNCLVHRGGVISEKDITSDNQLDVKWIKLMMVLQSEDGEKELVLGEMVEKDSVLGMRNQEVVKTFTLGQQITFTADEFANISWGLFLFGNDLVQKINDLGLGKGFISEQKESA